jgi:hypothetical protein
MTWINDNWETVLAIFGGVCIAARGIVSITPTETDNKVVESVIAFLTALTGLKRK